MSHAQILFVTLCICLGCILAVWEDLGVFAFVLVLGPYAAHRFQKKLR